MRRTIVILTILLAATAAQAEPQTQRGIVVSYECKQIDPEVTGFSCEFNAGQLHLQWHIDPDNLRGNDRDRALYEFNKIQLRFLSLGGKSFEIGFDHWPKGAVRTCSTAKGHPWYDTWCTDYGRN